MDEQQCEHRNVVQDQFAKLPGVVRHVPGDCYCLDCKQPVAMEWKDRKRETKDG